MLTKKQLQNLTTKRLLAYLKAERGRMISFVSHHTCSCCGEVSWDLEPKKYTKELAKFKQFESNLEIIKTVLSKREHIKK